MEDIDKPKAALNDGVEEEEEQEEAEVLTVDAKMGADEVKMRDRIVELAKYLNENEDLDFEDDVTIPNMQELAKTVQDTINKEFGTNWNAIVGKRFSLGAGLRETDKYANFKIGSLNVIVFQSNQKP